MTWYLLVRIQCVSWLLTGNWFHVLSTGINSRSISLHNLHQWHQHSFTQQKLSLLHWQLKNVSSFKRQRKRLSHYSNERLHLKNRLLGITERTQTNKTLANKTKSMILWHPRLFRIINLNNTKQFNVNNYSLPPNDKVKRLWP